MFNTRDTKQADLAVPIACMCIAFHPMIYNEIGGFNIMFFLPFFLTNGDSNNLSVCHVPLPFLWEHSIYITFYKHLIVNPDCIPIL